MVVRGGCRACPFPHQPSATHSRETTDGAQSQTGPYRAGERGTQQLQRLTGER